MWFQMKMGVLGIFLLMTSPVWAAEYALPTTEESLIGQLDYSKVANHDSAASIAQRYDIGYNALQNANPHINFAEGFNVGAPLQIPNLHLLPDLPRKGIVVNLPEMRIYYYPTGSDLVLSYPIGIGKIGRTIPITKTSVTRKATNPVWIPPQSIRSFNLEQGIILPKVMPAGPDNPLGPYAIYMRLPAYLFHSTIFPESVGRRASFGCLRMYESDIASFYPMIQKGIPVVIINAPIKVGWQNDRLYLEAYAPLEEHSDGVDSSFAGMIKKVEKAIDKQAVIVDWQIISYIANERDGIPHEIGVKI